MAQAQLEAACATWITAVSQQAVGADFAGDLKSGVVLCNTINALKPGMITQINTQPAVFRQAENLTAFVLAAKMLGVSNGDGFVPEDLQKGRNLPKVAVCVAALAQAAHAAGLTPHTVSSPALEEVRQLVAAQDAHNAANPLPSKLSLFEANQAKAQSLSNGQMKGNIIKSTDNQCSQSTLSFAETNMAKSQKEASSAATQARSRNIVNSASGAGSGSGLSYAETRQAAAQKEASSVNKQKDKLSSNHGPASQSTLSFAEQSQANAQKIASGANAQSSSIVRTESGAGSNVLSLSELKVLESQKMISGAHATGHNIVRGDHGAVGPVVNSP